MFHARIADLRDRGFFSRLVLCASLFAILSAGSSALFAAPAFTATQMEAIASEGRSVAQAALARSGGSAITAALMDEHGPVWVGQFGFAERETGRIPDADTMFGICSVSKMFAAVSTMILADRGLVRLDSPLVDFLPGFRMADPRYGAITVRMLLDHSSGFPGADLRNAMTLEAFGGLADQTMRTLSMSRLKHEPGWMSVYANDGFSVIESLVKAVSGMDYTDFVHKEILEPLGMRHSGYTLEASPPQSWARVYFDGEAAPWMYLNMYGSGGLLSTPSDMARFGMMLANGGELEGVRILSESSVREMGQDRTAGTFNPLPSDLIRFGLGWDTIAQPGLGAAGLSAWQKGGDITGFYGATMIVLPGEKLVAAVLGASGIGSSDAGAIAERLILKALVERGRLAAMPAQAKSAASRGKDATLAQRLATEGYYASSGALMRARFMENGTLSVQKKAGKDWITLYGGLSLRSDGWYSAEDPAVRSLRFLGAEGRRYFGIRMPAGNGHYLVPLLYAQGLDAAPPLPEAWSGRIGFPWLLADDNCQAAYPADPTDPRMTLSVDPELPGYLFYDHEGLYAIRPDASGTLGAMFLLIPGAQGRDLNDLVAETIDGTEYLRIGGARFRSSATLPLLAPGRSFLVAGGENLGEWRKLPASGSLSLSGAQMWRLYDGDFAMVASGTEVGDAKLPGIGEASYLVVYGEKGLAMTLDLADR